MKANEAAATVLAAVRVMERARSACANLAPLGMPMSAADLEQRARVVAAVINASAKLQQLRNRALALESALARFKQRRLEIAA